MIPIAIFVIAYLLGGSVHDLYRGVYVLPQQRLENAAWDFPPFLTVIASLPYAAMVCIPFSPVSTKTGKICGAAVIVLLGFALAFSGTGLVYYAVWHSARSLGVIAVLAGCRLLTQIPRDRLVEPEKRQKLFLILCITGLLGWVQFPFPAPVYFLYITPLVCLALLAVVTLQDNMPTFRHFVAMLFYLLFATIWSNPHVWAIGVAHVPLPQESVMNNRKGQLRLANGDNHVYTELVNFIRGHSNSNYIYAGPDCPEIYFLSGKRNPTRKIFDFFSNEENDWSFVLNVLKEREINLVVINRKPQFSAPLDTKVTNLFETRFPTAVEIGQFTVRWKE